MDKFFDNIWVLRATAFILAILLFFYVKAELTDKNETTTSNNQVDIITDVPLEAYYDSENFIVTGLPETVDVTIEGPMQLVLQTKFKKDFKVFVDLRNLLIGEHRVTIQHENFSDKLKVTINPEVVDVVIEEKVSQEFKVEPEINSRSLADGYIIRSMSVEPSKVTITGAKSVIESISNVKATVSPPKEIKESFTQEANVRVLDGNLNKLDVSVEPQTVKVMVEVEEYSRRVPLTLKQTGAPPQGVVIHQLETDTKSVVLYGPKSIIDSLKSLVVEFDVSQVNRSGNFEVNLKLPKGATRINPDKIVVRANVSMTPTQSTETAVDETTSENPNNADGANDVNEDENHKINQ